MLAFVPPAYVLYWLYGRDSRPWNSSYEDGCENLIRPSVENIAYEWHSEGGSSLHACCIRCPCLNGKERLANVIAFVLVTCTWLPVLLALSILVSAFFATVGSLIVWFYLIVFICRVVYATMTI